MPFSFIAKAAPGRPGRMCLAASAVILGLLGTACGGANSPVEEETKVGTGAVDNTAAVDTAAVDNTAAVETAAIDTSAVDTAVDTATVDTTAVDTTAGEPIDVVLAQADTAAAAAAEIPAIPGDVGEDMPDDRVTTMSTTTTTVPNCERVPPSVSTAVTRRVTDFGAVRDDGRDDTAAIQKAMDATKSGETLLFPAGRYQIGKSLHVRNPGTILRGESGAIIHATNPDSMAILIEQDRTTVQGLTFTAITDRRRSSAQHSRIAVAGGNSDGTWRWIYDTVVRDNKILPSGAPGTSGANSASTAGILMVRADRFVIANNTVSRTLADGIHITNGSRNGRILNNTVRENGDDSIAVVSYVDGGNPALNKASTLLTDWIKRIDHNLDKNILIAGNTVGGQYWGRGISVVGGEKVSIVRNLVDNAPLSAAILLAREASYQTFGTTNVKVESNTIRNVQNMAPPYDPKGTYSTSMRMGHGAVEIHAYQFDDEAANSTLRNTLTVRDVAVRNNTVERTTVSAVRLGAGGRKTLGATNSSGTIVYRTYAAAPLRIPSIEVGRFNSVGKEPLSVQSADLQQSGVHCSGNLRDGATYQPSVCRTAAPVVTGSMLSCTSDGKLQY